eukprot:jgi/Ulvmu1/5943/UM026_0065.1
MEAASPEDNSVPGDILEHLSCLADCEASTPASWDEEGSKSVRCSCTRPSKAGTDGPQSTAPESAVYHNGFALSVTDTQDCSHQDLFVRTPPTQLLCCRTLRQCCRSNCESMHAPTAPYSQSATVILPQLSRRRPIPVRDISQVFVPTDAVSMAGRTRRKRAAQVTHSGPPRMAVPLRPVSASLLPRLLDRELLLHACGVELPEAVQEIKLVNKGLNAVDACALKLFTRLQSLVLENNLLDDISPFGLLQSLVSLNVACNKITQLPDLSAGLFHKLQLLDISFNLITGPDVLSSSCTWSSLPSLRQLDLSGNMLKYLPDVVGSFPALVTLHLEFNELTGECLCPLAKLPCLEQLGLADNHISDIPRHALQLDMYKNLKLLDVSRNRIRKPEDLESLKQLWNGTVVYIGDNPIARKLRLQLLQPHSIPGSCPSTVQLPCDPHETMCTTLFARGKSRWQNHGAPTDIADSLPLCARPDSDASAANVVLKVSRNLSQRPTIANSIMNSILPVKKATTEVSATAWNTNEDASDRLLHMFDALQCDLEKWQRLEPVPEETPSLLETELPAQSGDVADTSPQPSLPIGFLKGNIDVPGRCLPKRWSAPPTVGNGDPTERIASELGLNHHMLSHHTGLLGTDANGALSRLRFILARCGPEAILTSMKPKQHRSHTHCSALKQHPKQSAVSVVLEPPGPASPHIHQIDMIQEVLRGMRNKGEVVKDELAAQIQLYQHFMPEQQHMQDGTVHDTQEQDVEQSASTHPLGDCQQSSDHQQVGSQGQRDCRATDMAHAASGTQHTDENETHWSRKSDLIQSAAQTQLGYVLP